MIKRSVGFSVRTPWAFTRWEESWDSPVRANGYDQCER